MGIVEEATLDIVIKDGATVANMPTVKFLSKISLGCKNETDSNHPIEYPFQSQVTF